MQICEYPSIPQAPADADVLAIEVNGITYKISKATLASAIIAQLDVANNLTTTTAGKVLDARQGKALKDLFDGLVSSTSVSDLSDIPINTSGYIGITNASANPKGNTSAQFAYHCFGKSDRRALIMMYTAGTTPEVYVNTYHGAWRGWKTVTLA